jgi:hypothetical protein
MPKFKIGQDVEVKATGAKTHVIAIGSNNRYILQNGDNVKDTHIRPIQAPAKKKGFFRRG